jgi:hypothetical protein
VDVGNAECVGQVLPSDPTIPIVTVDEGVREVIATDES